MGARTRWEKIVAGLAALRLVALGLATLGLASGFIAGAGGAFAQAQAQSWPERPLTMIVPFAPGGANDITARSLADPLGEALGQRVIVENRGGAGGNIGITAAQRAKPDGYAMLLASTGFVVNPSLYQHVTYDPVRDFEPVAYLAQFPVALVVNKATKINSMKELIERARAKPGALNYSSAGAGTATHLAAELVKLRAGIQIVHVPHSGAAPALQSLLTESVDLGSLSISSVQGHVQAGTITPLAVTGSERWPDLPDVPTLQEAGVANAVAETWQGMLVPAGTPKPIVDKLAAALVDIVKRPDVKQKLLNAGYSATGGGPEVFAKIIAEEVPKWKEVITLAGIQPQ